MKAIFVELPAFEANRSAYLSDDEYRILQNALLLFPTCGDVIMHTGGLRKLRFLDRQRNTGQRGGTRIIYYWWLAKSHFLLITLYGKSEVNDLTFDQKKMLGLLLKQHKAKQE
ncbi:toxin [Rahnella ecdela]|uniref:Toxin n=1 Tax=Rahnella ecdela TaxID=2816250 RepID=A0ABS6LAM7_9GAMM|nr:toxin [Rahnella ecdela]MBU9843989.1 toxin [Rahnella ecdela]